MLIIINSANGLRYTTSPVLIIKIAASSVVCFDNIWVMAYAEAYTFLMDNKSCNLNGMCDCFEMAAIKRYVFLENLSPNPIKYVYNTQGQQQDEDPNKE